MEKIELINYRCFEHLELSFGSGVTLLVGDNASGKTTLIRALSSVLNSFFVGFSDEHTRFFGLSKDDFRVVKVGDGLITSEEPILVNFSLLHQDSTLELRSKKGRTLQLPLDAIGEYAYAIQHGLFKDGKQAIALPLFAGFSTSDIHSSRKISKEPFKQYAHKPSFGYYECLAGDGFLDYWVTRLLVLREGNTGELEVLGVLGALIRMLGPDGCNVIHDIHVRPIQGNVYYYLADGRVTDTDNLSDGLRRLVNIGMDLAFRCMLLNRGIYGLEACAKSEGTVLIDEIDLHLHPSLQSVVIKGLKNAFPKLQFIITSHAPMVMTGISMDEVNKIIQLGYSQNVGYTAREITTYGMDATTIIETVLGIVPRAKEVDDQLSLLFDLIDNDDYVAAKEKLNEMREEFGDRLPDLVRAETMIHFFNGSQENDPDQ